jgi:3-hydroxybutyryl-CoA dehydrogenase
VDAALGLMSAWGKRPVKARDVPGFIVNRVARPYYAEGFAALGEGLPPADIDHALTAAGGCRMGPLALADLIGHDVNYAVARSVFEAYGGQTRFRPQPAQQALRDAGRFGRKSGSGVYDYAGERPSPGLAGPCAAPSGILVSDRQSALAPLAALARSAGLVVDTDPAIGADVLVIDGVRLALSDGRRLINRPDIDVLVDQARDFATANTLVVTATDAHSAYVAAGFAQAVGQSALFVADRPGMIVLRTLAQLANAAADAATDQVASLEGIDQAMMLGANHPEGPLDWARRYGAQRLVTVLGNIALEAGDALYHPAPFFMAAATSTTQEMDLV